MGALVDDPDEEEQGARDDAVGDHLEDRALQPLLVEDEDAERHEAHVADRRVGDEPLEVGLAHGHDGSVDHPDDRERDDEPGELVRRVGEERQREADEAVGAELQHDPGEDDRAGRRGLGVRVGQPRVERPHGHLDREREEEAEERPELERGVEAEGRERPRSRRRLPTCRSSRSTSRPARGSRRASAASRRACRGRT